MNKNIKVKEVIVKSGCDKFLPFGLTLGLFVILFGTSSSGGGFQGGVLVASACLLIYLGHGYGEATRSINMEFIRINEAIGATLYVLLGMCGLVLGVRFCQNVFYDIGAVGDLISAGTITFMSYAVGYKVLTGVGFLLLLLLGLLAPEVGTAAEESAAPVETVEAAAVPVEAAVEEEKKEDEDK
jgi:multicomponent Na+:H+ antiporter subunit B